MKRRMAVGVCCVMFMLAAVVFVRAAEPAGEKPRKQGMGRLTQPWSKISGLSDEQKTRIREIHGKAVAEINAIRERENADIMALLTDEQKAEAQKLIDEQRKSRPAASAAKDDAGGSSPAKVEEKRSTPAAE
jgi:hypothetical protein